MRVNEMSMKMKLGFGKLVIIIILLLLHELLHRIKHFSLKGEPQLLSMCVL